MNHPLSEYKIAGLNLPHITSNNKLRQVLTAALPKQERPKIDLSYRYWNAEFFNLNRVKIFQDASDREQSAILELVNRSLLEEA